MNQHYREASNRQADRAATDIFRFPSWEKWRQEKEQQPAIAREQPQPVETTYKDEDLSGCLSGSLRATPKPATPNQPVETNYKDEDLSGCLSGSLRATPNQPVETTYKDEDLSGCLSGWLKPKSTEPKTSQRDRYLPTQRNVNTGEITPIERDDLSGTLAPLDEEKSGWLYFN
jgi:hypothetical protein